ncbi:hypothetical protein [Caminibacter pacificus]
MIKFKNLKVPVSRFFIKDNFLYIVDEINRVLIFDMGLSFFKGFRLKFEKNSPKENGVKFSNKGKFLAVTSKNRVGVWNIEEKKHLETFEFKHDILAVSFLNEEYLACGGIDGEIYLINLEILKRVAKLPKHKDFITDIVFVDEDYICAGGYDKAVIFSNLSSFNSKKRFLHIKPVKKIEKKEDLISADEISDIVKWDEYKHTSIDRVDFYRKFSDFWIDGEFLVILSKNRVMIYDLKNEVILNDKFLEFENMEKVVIYSNKMIISTTNGELYYKDLFEEEKELLDAILKEDFKKAYDLIDKNPFLKRSEGFKRLIKYEELLIKKAILLFEKSEIEAVKVLQPLLKVPNKREEIEKLIKHYKNLAKFKNAVLKGNYALAYELANMYEELKKTKYYKILELRWQKTYEKAYQAVINGEFEKAKELLEPFMAVTQKLPLIELLLKKAEILKIFKEKIAKKDFKGVYALLKEHPELKESVEYQKLITYAENLYKFALKFLEKEEFQKAKKAAMILKDIEEYEDKAIEILNMLEVIFKFLALIADNKIDEALKLAEMYEFLRKLKSYKEIQEKFRQTLKQAEKEMLENKTKALDLLGEYKNMKMKLPRIQSMIKEMQ